MRGRRLSLDSASRQVAVLVAGRAVGFVAAFAIPVVLARIFVPAEFGTYKQLFLVFSTFYGVAQLGMAESLYYFVPQRTHEAGRYVCNALVTLALAGLGCLGLLYIMREPLAAWLGNSEVAGHLVLVGMLLALTLVAAAFEIVMISRHEHVKAAVTYATSDIARSLLLVIPALKFGGVRAVIVGAVAFGALRLAAMLVYMWREFDGDLRIDFAVWRRQLTYALPFALAVGIEVIQQNFHQYVVASSFDAATFAFYAVGCLQIPFVDLVMTSTVNVMMVQMAVLAKEGDRRGAIALWHSTIAKLAFLLFPLACFLSSPRADHRHAVHHRYLASVPIFVVWIWRFCRQRSRSTASCGHTRDSVPARDERHPLRARRRADPGRSCHVSGLGAILITVLSTAFVRLLGHLESLPGTERVSDRAASVAAPGGHHRMRQRCGSAGVLGHSHTHASSAGRRRVRRGPRMARPTPCSRMDRSCLNGPICRGVRAKTSGDAGKLEVGRVGSLESSAGIGHRCSRAKFATCAGRWCIAARTRRAYLGDGVGRHAPAGHHRPR